MLELPFLSCLNFIVSVEHPIFLVVVILDSFVRFLCLDFFLLGFSLLIKDFVLETYVVHAFTVIFFAKHAHKFGCACKNFALSFVVVTVQVHFIAFSAACYFFNLLLAKEVSR